MKKRLFFLTGEPGVGKTTVFLNCVNALKAAGLRVGGMVSREVRSRGTRVGFEIRDLDTGRGGWLAHVNQKNGPRIGKYRVNVTDLESIAVAAVINAVKNADTIGVDEIGPMELTSERFRDAAKKAVESRKPLLGVVHWKTSDSLINEVKTRKDAELFEVTYENRDHLHETIVKKAIEAIE
jgi:nucleoside-triphosphatase